jgi:predicted SAM-dependent methyltransferase
LIIKKLNLGCGKQKLDGYINLDIANGENVYPLGYIEDGSCDEIRASHVLEHFSHREVYNVLKNWVDKLKIGGLLKIAVPDLKKIAQNYIEQKEQNTQGYLMGGHVDDNDYHKAIFDAQSLKQLFEVCGLIDVKPWNDYQDTCALPISLNLQGTKSERSGPVKIVAVMSMPRLCFTDNIFAAHKAFLPLGINIEKGTGVFWEQVLTRMLEKNMDADYLITLDYDSYFQQEHVIRLCQLMQENEVDAIVPLQSKREGENNLFGRTTDQPNEGNLIPIVTGHFGLTIFRTSALRKLSKPWIWGQPNPDGTWGENRLDPDIYFWKKFHEEGFKTCLSKEVIIGHLQLMCTYPSPNGPVHLYLNDVNEGKIPEAYIPKVEFVK